MFDFNVVLFKPVQKNQNLVAWIHIPVNQTADFDEDCVRLFRAPAQLLPRLHDTVEVYRKAVDFFIEIMLRHRDPKFTELKHDNDCIRLAEGLNVVNKDIAVKTANFIVKLANEFKVDVIVMEHRDLTGRKRGTKRQRLHHWRAKYV